MIVIDSFLNLLNAAIGRKQDFEQLIQSCDISRVLASMESKAEETAIAIREYDPKKHLINRREDKIILDKDGNLKRKIKRWKLPIGYPVFINEIALVFIYGQPVKWGMASDKTDKAFKAFTDLLSRTHFNAKIRQCKRIAGSETQSAMLWRVFRNDDGKADCQIRVLAASKGDEIYTKWDQYENLISVAWGYYVNEGGSSVYHVNLYTDNVTYHCKRTALGWEVIPEENLIGKIPIIYFSQDKEWEGVEQMIHREEYIASRTADTNDYFSDPMLILDADIIKNMPEKDNENKTLIKKNGSKAEEAAHYLTWDNAPESKKNEIDWLQNHILSKTFTPNIDFENMKSLSNVTGKALKQMMILANIKSQKHKENHDELLDRVAGLCASIIGNVMDVSLKAECEALKTTHEFQEPFGEDITEVIENIGKSIDSGTMSVETGVEQNPLIKDKQNEIKRLEEDSEKRTQEQRDIFAQAQRQALGLGEEDDNKTGAE